MEHKTVEVTNASVENKFKLVISNLTETINKRGWVINQDLNSIKFDINHLTRNGLKKLDKKLSYILKKDSIGSINKFFWYLKLKNVITETVKVEYSNKELEIKEAKKQFNLAKAKFQETLENYKKVKGDFYKN